MTLENLIEEIIDIVLKEVEHDSEYYEDGAGRAGYRTEYYLYSADAVRDKIRKLLEENKND